MRRTYTIKQAAKELDIGPRQLTNKLIKNGLFISRDGTRLPKAELIKKGYFSTKLEGYFVGPVWHSYRKALVTDQGIELLKNTITTNQNRG